jgi:hypothetical protein
VQRGAREPAGAHPERSLKDLASRQPRPSPQVVSLAEGVRTADQRTLTR